MTNILVVGGAGYIGSHTCLDVSNKGFTPVVYDNLFNGHAEFVRWGPLERGDIRDRGRLDSVFKKYRPAAVVHFAALIEVGKSVRNPAGFFENNVAGTLTLLLAAQAAGVKNLVFSSTCATYGLPEALPMDETHPQAPINPYGRSKLIVEQMLRDLDTYANFRSVVLRYFNAAGADPEGRIGEWHSPKRTPSHWRSRRRWVGDQNSRSSVPTTIRATAPACAISFTSWILPTRIHGPSSICSTAARALHSISERARERR